MTEAEARTKWCPMNRLVRGMGDTIFTNMPNAEANTCAASLRMAWRKIPAKREHFAAKDDDEMTAQGWVNTGEVADYGYWYTFPATGYCGLAGKP